MLESTYYQSVWGLRIPVLCPTTLHYTTLHAQCLLELGHLVHYVLVALLQPRVQRLPHLREGGVVLARLIQRTCTHTHA
jgi:hypothetical protein